MADDVPTFGYDYDLERWSTGEYGADGKLIWHSELPSNADWEHVRLVTLNFDPGGEGDFRNYNIPAGRPLNVYGTIDDWPEGEPYFDLDDLAAQAFEHYGFEF